MTEYKTNAIVEPNAVIIEPQLNALDLADIERKKQLCRERSKTWRENNKVKNNEYKRDYYAKNGDKMRAYSKVYMKNYLDENPEKRLEHNAKCRATNPIVSDEEKLVKKAERVVKRAKKQVDFVIEKSTSVQKNYDDALMALNFLKVNNDLGVYGGGVEV